MIAIGNKGLIRAKLAVYFCRVCVPDLWGLYKHMVGRLLYIHGEGEDSATASVASKSRVGDGSVL